MIGDGALYRLCRELQRELFDPPDTTWSIEGHRPTKLRATPAIEGAEPDRRYRSSRSRV
jgi:hypothetical protein